MRAQDKHQGASTRTGASSSDGGGCKTHGPQTALRRHTAQTTKQDRSEKGEETVQNREGARQHRTSETEVKARRNQKVGKGGGGQLRELLLLACWSREVQSRFVASCT
jgi:hypothetical protein